MQTYRYLQRIISRLCPSLELSKPFSLWFLIIHYSSHFPWPLRQHSQQGFALIPLLWHGIHSDYKQTRGTNKVAKDIRALVQITIPSQCLWRDTNRVAKDNSNQPVQITPKHQGIKRNGEAPIIPSDLKWQFN